MRNSKPLWVMILFIVLFISCNDSSYNYKIPEHYSLEKKEKILKQKQWIDEHRNSTYHIENMSDSKDEAVNRFLLEAHKGSRDGMEKFILSKKEYMEMFWPNFPYEQTLALGKSPDNMWSVLEARRETGMQDLLKTLHDDSTDESFEMLEVNWRKNDVRKYGPFTAFIIDAVSVKLGDVSVKLEEPRFVIEYKGKYKLAHVVSD